MRDKQCHLARLPGDRLRYGVVQPAAASLVLVRCDHDQVGRVAPQKRQHRLHRIRVVGDHFSDINAERRHCRTRTILREEPPPGERFPDAREIGPLCRHAWGDVHHGQLRLGDERRFEGMCKGHFTRCREIRRVQDAVNDRYTVILECTHSWATYALASLDATINDDPHLLLTGRTASGCSRDSWISSVSWRIMRHSPSRSAYVTVSTPISTSSICPR